MSARRTRKPVLRDGMRKALKDIGIVAIKPIHEILNIAENAEAGKSDDALRLVSTQIQARKIELDGLDLKSKKTDLNYSLKLMNEITILSEMRQKIESVQGFIGTYGSS